MEPKREQMQYIRKLGAVDLKLQLQEYQKPLTTTSQSLTSPLDLILRLRRLNVLLMQRMLKRPVWKTALELSS
jgi:hypothetical protein